MIFPCHSILTMNLRKNFIIKRKCFNILNKTKLCYWKHSFNEFIAPCSPFYFYEPFTLKYIRILGLKYVATWRNLVYTCIIQFILEILQLVSKIIVCDTVDSIDNNGNFVVVTCNMNSLFSFRYSVSYVSIVYTVVLHASYSQSLVVFMFYNGLGKFYAKTFWIGSCEIKSCDFPFLNCIKYTWDYPAIQCYCHRRLGIHETLLCYPSLLSWLYFI